MDGAMHAQRLYKWLDDRFHINEFVSFAQKKSVPLHRSSYWYYLGGVTLFLFITQIVTGVLLMMYYKPGIETAHESMAYILSEVEFGWLIRSIHSWSANLFILAAFLHLFSVFFTTAFRKPRELTWLSGFVLLALALGFGFSGYLLPWNELSYFATKVGTDIMGVVPLIGRPLLLLLRGGETVGDVTLHRFFALHVAILPAITFVLVCLHLVFVQRQGMSAPHGWEEADPATRRSMPFFPNFLLRDVLLWLIVLNVLAILAVVAPFGIEPLHWPLGEKADAFAPAPQGIKPEWYFMFMFQALKFLPPHIGPLEGELVGVLGFMVAGLIWLMVPFWDRPAPGGRMRTRTRALGVVSIVFIVVMTVWGYLT
jgi:cytochrome b6